MKKISHLWFPIALALIALSWGLSSSALDRTQAEQELQQTPAQQAKAASEVQVDNRSMLSLQDPFENTQASTWLWQTSILFENYEPSAQNEFLNQNDNVSAAGKTVMPILGLGAQVKAFEAKSGVYRVGLEAQVGYITQNRELQTATQKLDDVRINSTLLQGLLQLRWSPALSSRWNLGLATGFGQLNLTQTSSQSLARFSKTRNFAVHVASLSYGLTKNWALEANYLIREASAGPSNQVEIPNQNWQLGTRIIW